MKKGKIKLLDTVRLEVRTDGRQELSSSPGAREFASGHPIKYAGSGALGQGSFGPDLENVLENSNVVYTYKGEETAAGRRLARFDYRLAPMWGGEIIRLPEGSGTVGLHGSFWADVHTYDIVRLEMSADNFPPTLPLIEAVTIINYARTTLENGLSTVLPVSGDFRMVKFSGETSHNQIAFSNCRVYGVETRISFDAPVSPAPVASAVPAGDDALQPLPNGLQVQVKLATRIPGDLPVGSLIRGVVASAVRKDGSVLIAAGSPLLGRIRRLERNAEAGYFVVAFEFTEVQSQGIRYRFSGDLLGFDAGYGLERNLSSYSERIYAMGGLGGSIERSKWETTTLPDLPGAAAFFFSGEKLDLPPGFTTLWKTSPAKP